MNVPFVFALYVWILLAMGSLEPGRDHRELAHGFAVAINEVPSVFPNDPDKILTASTLVAIGYRESGLVLDIAAKNGEASYCALQVNVAAGGTPALRTDATACARAALRILRMSVQYCPQHPIGFYAAGFIGCQSRVAQNISADRMAIAAQLRRKVPPAGVFTELAAAR